mgnify:FL=1
MPWKNGRYIPRVLPPTPMLANKTTQPVRGPLSDSQISDGFFTSALVLKTFMAGSLGVSVLKHLIPSGLFSASRGLRALFSPGFVNGQMLESGAVTGAKITNPIKIALVAGAAAGSITVSGVGVSDELIGVFQQHATTKLLSDLSTEFSIVKADTISNTGGSSTNTHTLLVFYLSK